MLQTTYGVKFNKGSMFESRNDIKIDRLMRNTLNQGFTMQQQRGNACEPLDQKSQDIYVASEEYEDDLVESPYASFSSPNCKFASRLSHSKIENKNEAYLDQI